MARTDIALYTGWLPRVSGIDLNVSDEFAHYAPGEQIEPGVFAGCHPEGVFVFAATSVDQLNRQYYTFPEATVTGVVCGECTDNLEVVTRHASVAHVRVCWSTGMEAAAEHRAELWAENAWLRHAEGGWDTTGAYAAEIWEDERRMAS